MDITLELILYATAYMRVVNKCISSISIVINQEKRQRKRDTRETVIQTREKKRTWPISDFQAGRS